MPRISLRALALVFVVVGVFPSPMRAQQSTSAPPVAADQPTLAAAQELAGKGRLEKALAILDQLASLNPTPAGVERLRGMIFYQQERFPEAMDSFAKAEAQDSADRESTEMHGVILFRQGKSPEAIPYLERANTAIERANIDPQYVLGLCYADVQRYDDARHAFAAQYGFAPDSAEAYLVAARLFLRRELAAAAAAQARKALEINPVLPGAHQLLGEVALAQADTAAAVQELEAEHKTNPLNAVMYDRLGDAYLRSGQYEQAKQALNRAVLLEPNSTAPYILLGEVFLKLNQPIQSIHYLDRAVRMDPANYITHNLLGQAYKATGQLAEANREFKMVVDLQHGQRQSMGK